MAGLRSIFDILDEHLLSSELQLPTYSPVAARMQALAQHPDTDIRDIEQAILQDAVLAAQVLRAANSAMFAGLAKLNTIGQAIGRLGIDQVVNLVVLCTQAGEYHARNATIDQSMVMLWRHAMGCALGAKWLAEHCGQRQLAPQAFLGGLFHDIGKLLLLKVFDDLEGRPDSQGRLSSTLVREVLIAQHAEQGARLLTHWNLAECYVGIARDHHAPTLAPDEPLTALVRLADLTCGRLGLSLNPNDTLVLSASPEAALLGVDDATIVELESALEEAMRNFSKAA